MKAYTPKETAPAETGRKEAPRMVGQEYWGFRCASAGLTMAKDYEVFERRCKALDPQAWRNFRSGFALMKKALESVRASFTPEEKRKIDREMSGDIIRLVKAGPAMTDNDEKDCLMIDRKTVMWFVEYVAREECSFCEKRGDKCKRCPVKQKLDSVFAHRMPNESAGLCIWSEYAVERDGSGRTDMMSLLFDENNEDVFGEAPAHIVGKK